MRLAYPGFFFALKSLVELTDKDHQKILQTIYEHAWFIARRLSLYSSLGNHTICESVGLVFAGAIFRDCQDGRAWLRKGIELLEQELCHQILEDGGPVEQSLAYHRFVLDLYWLALDFLEKNGLHDCRAWRPRLLAGEEFLRAFQDDQGKAPSIGDSDDGHAVAPGISPARPSVQAAKPGYQTFPQAGYTVIRGRRGLIFTFDHGPLGMPPLYGHGHADALSITLSVNGKAMLVDPGTYRYNGVPEWRRYFKSTRAHNTVTVDGLDQAEQETGFIWSKPYKAKLIQAEKNQDGLVLLGYHDGYRRLKRPVWHYRSIFFFDESLFLIRDTFAGAGVHDFEVNFHLHPDAAVSSADDWWVAEQGRESIYIKLLAGGAFSLIKGEENPPRGWFSPAYGLKMESGVLSCRGRGEPRSISFLTAIGVGSPDESEELQQRAAAICRVG